MPPEGLRPDWDVPPQVRALMSTRQGGIGVAPFDSNNLALDAADPAVPENRRRFAAVLRAEPRWLHQVHGADVVRLQVQPWARPPRADASVSSVPGLACAVFAADCLPVLFCAADGRAVAAAHAGWRGLAAGVLDNTVAALCAEAACPPQAVVAWLGPCIGPRQFEVGADVVQAFGHDPARTDDALWCRRDRADGSPRWLADLAGLARQRLVALGVGRVSGGDWCTVEDASRFFSFRRDAGTRAGVGHGPAGHTGRMVAAVAIVV